MRTHPDSLGTPFSTRVAHIVLNTDPSVLADYFAGRTAQKSSLGVLHEKVQQTFLAVYSGEPEMERRVAGIWGETGVVVADNSLDSMLAWRMSMEEEQGIGGAQEELQAQRNALSGQTLEQAKTHLLSLYQDANTQEYPMIAGQYVRDDTIAGRIFHGLYQNGFSMSDDDFKLALVEAEKVLGVSAARLWYQGRYRQFDAFQKTLIAEWHRLGMGSIFLGSDASSKIAHTSGQLEIASLTLSKTSYNAEDDFIRMTFDVALPTGTQNFTPAVQRVYMVNALTGQQLPGNGLSVRFINGNTIEISTQQMLQASSNGITFSDLVQFKLALWSTDDVSLPGLQGKNTTAAVQMDVVKRAGLSTNPDSNLAHTEDVILEQVLLHFPVKDPNTNVNNWDTSNWRWDLGSGFHGEEEFHALDLNFGVGESDRGLSVHAIADGKIVAINPRYGAVTIEHTANGVTWRTEYMHMLVYDVGNGSFVVKSKDGDILKTLKVGDETLQGDLIGTIGGTGQTYTDANGNGFRDANEPLYTSDRAFGSHFHSVNFMVVNNEWKSIDTRKVIEQLGFTIMAYDGGSDQNAATTANNKGYEVIWNDDVGGFVPKDGTKLVYDRSLLETVASSTTPSYWLAWEEGKTVEEMARVVWDGDAGAWVQWDSFTNSFFRQDGHRKIWIPSSQSWLTEQ